VNQDEDPGTYPNKSFHRFLGLFWAIFHLNDGGNIGLQHMTLIIWIENRIKRTQKSTENFY
jgi:hypothetical protein